MIDYLEELLEEETAVSLTERPLGGWEEFPQEEAETAVPQDQQKPWGPALPPEPEAPAEPGREGSGSRPRSDTGSPAAPAKTG